MLYGVRFDSGDFMMITATSEEQATDILNEACFCDFEICNAEDLIDDQYNGLAILGTV